MPMQEVKEVKGSSILEKIKNNKSINRQHKLTQDFFGFNMDAISKKNIKTMRSLLAKKSASLSAEEIKIFNTLVQSYTLKHATNAGMEIMQSGQIQSIRQLEAQGLKTSRHTPHSSAQDLSIFFVLGIGAHKTPPFTDEASHLVTINLEKLQQRDPLALKRLWVGGHLTEYHQEREHTIKLGSVIFSTIHKKDLNKIYRFTDSQGLSVEWKLRYEDEIFSGPEVVPGITLQFLYMLRLLGGLNNPLISKLYAAAKDNSAQFLPLLEKIFSHVMVGWIYPEAKIIDVLKIDPSYADVSESKAQDFDNIKQDAVLAAIGEENSQLLNNVLKKKYVYQDSKVFDKAMDIRDKSIRMDILKQLVAHGANPIKDAERLRLPDNNSMLHKIAEKGTAQELDFLLSQEYPDRNEPLIKQLPNPNLVCKQEYLDLVDLVCKTDYSGEKLEVLKKHGADFIKHGTTYVRSALSAYQDYSPIPNVKAVVFLANQGVLLQDDNLNNKTPLMLACQFGNLLLVRFLVEKMKAEINKPLRFYAFSLLAMKEFDEDASSGMTALHYAASYGHKDIVEYLLSMGADPSLKTNQGQLAIDLVDEKHGEIKSLLLRPGQDLGRLKLKEEKGTDLVKLSKKDKVAVMVKGTRKDGKDYVVLGKPRSGEDNRRNYYCFPGGSVDKTDPSLEAAAMRELLEETGIDVKKFPEASIKKIATFEGFQSEEHHSTTFFLVDVGRQSVEVHPCDDLVDARRVLVEQLLVDKNKTFAKFMQYANTLVLGSNALIIQTVLSGSFSDEAMKGIENQLHIESNGYRMLFNAIAELKSEASDLMPVRKLLEENAHLAKNPFKYKKALAVEMAKINSMPGISLLHEHGVDITDTGDFEADFQYQHGSAMLVAIKAENLEMMKSLALLTKDFFYSYHYKIIMITEAAKCENKEILLFLLDQAINPNNSLEFDRLGTMIYPLIAMAMKKSNLLLMRALMDDGRVFLNRERSPMDRDPILLNALNHEEMEAARILLASCRLDLNLKSNPDNSSKKSQTALEFAQENHKEEAAELIAFHSNYRDMNDFLRKKGLPEMDGFQHVLCSDDKTTIHFYSNTLEKLQVFNQQNHFKFDIHKTNSQYYCRVGIRRLTSLVGSNVIAKYLLEFTKQSMFWAVRKDEHRQLHQDLVENKIKTLKAADIGSSETLYADEFYFKFYRQLIRENFSIQALELDIASEYQTALKLILAGIENHDKITQIQLMDSKPFDYTDGRKGKIWQQALQSSLSLKNLKILQCRDLPMACLLDLLEQIAKAWNKGDCKLSIEGNYTEAQYQSLVESINALQLSTEVQLPQMPAKQRQLMQKNKLSQFMQSDGLFSYKVNHISTAVQSPSLDTGMGDGLDSIEKQKMYFNLLLDQAKPQRIILRSVHDSELFALCQFLKTNTSIKSICFRNNHKDRWQEPQLTAVLNAIAESAMRLEELTLRWEKLDKEGMLALIKLITRHPLELLDFDGLKFKSKNEPGLFALLGHAIASNPSLIYIECDESLLEQGLANSKSLLLVKGGFFSKLKPDLKKSLDINREAFNAANASPVLALEYKAKESSPVVDEINEEQPAENNKRARVERSESHCSLM